MLLLCQTSKKVSIRINFPKCITARQSFGVACEEAFGGGKTVLFYACAEGLHDDGDPHYHVTMKLTRPQRWEAAKKKLSDMDAILVKDHLIMLMVCMRGPTDTSTKWMATCTTANHILPGE